MQSACRVVDHESLKYRKAIFQLSFKHFPECTFLHEIQSTAYTHVRIESIYTKSTYKTSNYYKWKETDGYAWFEFLEKNDGRDLTSIERTWQALSVCHKEILKLKIMPKPSTNSLKLQSRPFLHVFSVVHHLRDRAIQICFKVRWRDSFTNAHECHKVFDRAFKNAISIGIAKHIKYDMLRHHYSMRPRRDEILFRRMV